MRKVLVVGAAVTVVAAGGAAVALSGGGGGGEAHAAALGTATVSRGDLVDSEKVDGTLTFEDERQVRTGASGTVTAAPKEGRTVKRGRTLLRVDGEPVTLMYGAVPMYRTLARGVSGGVDVEQLERNLRALGYGGGLTVDEEFTGATADAVREWQDDRGLAESGSVDAAQVVFLPGAVRVKEVRAPEGARTAGGQPVLTVTGTRQVVHLDLDAGKQDLARKGARVGVELPGGKGAEGRISDVGSVARRTGTGQDAKTTLDVEITLVKGAGGGLDQAPVTVALESERREGVLSVPVEALLALREGGFGVEVVEGSARRIVPVTTGAFGGGRVEVGGAVRAGMKVGVPAT
ncbi:peptidoglycan-binding protein [Spirillospora sp. NBC_01491]|uniref:peptidoglycan-binding protein n=1 Tax=Spirillospora sp. NBC_01491 TaxID=2976007 RepID=UPI002E32FA88|nr:peptidoglycan-binding protein [Spirillospora sp. NBC_01491]